MKFTKLKKGQLLVDRWYSYTPNKHGIQGRGEVTKISRKTQRAEIKFENGQVLVYDAEHIQEFMRPWKRGMKQKYHGQIIPQ